MKKIILMILLFFFSSFGVILFQLDADISSVAAQEIVEESREQKELKKLLKEMENLLRVAKEAGFSEEELQNITVERNGKTINVSEFIQQEKMKQQRQTADQFQPRDRYLTVQDITEELRRLESKKLDELRERLILSGEEQK